MTGMATVIHSVCSSMPTLDNRLTRLIGSSLLLRSNLILGVA
jgi:hypothetical protein